MNIVLIGSGNVATNLGLAFAKANHKIIQVYSNSASNAELLANKLNCFYTDRLNDVKDGDVYISAVKDNVCEDVWSQLKIGDKLVLHTSGSLGLDILSQHFHNYGVLYPLMTLSKTRPLDLSNVPFLIEGNNTCNESIINAIATSISSDVRLADSKQREIIHLAAVWANNFSNHMFSIAKTITDKNGLPFDLLFPLIEETCNKLKDLDPKEAQTGPAVRFDTKIIEKQTNNTPEEFRTLYKMISESIHRLAKRNEE